MKLPKLFLTLILIIGSLSLLSLPAFASSQLPINGTAQIVSTGGLLLFDTNNSLVTVDSGTGDMTGFVWSEDLGWIDFDNNGNANAVRVDLNTGVVSGLAYVPNTGGLIDFTNYNSNTVINIATGDISGYAWSEDFGWIDFSNTTLVGSLLPLNLTPSVSNASTTQEVLMSYTSASGFAYGDIVTLTWETGAGLILANTCSVPTTDANGSGATGGAGSVSIVGGNSYEYTFSEDTIASTLTFCVNVTAYSTPGNYSVVLSDDNGEFGIALYYVQNDNSVNIIANVAPTLSFNIRDATDTIDTNLCSLGTVTTASVSTCSYSLAIGTNAQGGFIVQIQALSDLTSGSSNIINVGDGGLFTAGEEKYGISSIIPGISGRNPLTGLYTESMILTSPFDGVANVPLVSTDFLSYTDGVHYVADGITTDVNIVTHSISIAAGTPAGQYNQIVTYTVTPTF